MDYTQYGALGAMLAASFVAVKMLWTRLNKKDEEHAKERAEWLDSLEKITEKADSTAKETNDIMRQTGGILGGLKALLENQNRNK